MKKTYTVDHTFMRHHRRLCSDLGLNIGDVVTVGVNEQEDKPKVKKTAAKDDEGGPIVPTDPRKPKP